MKRVLTTQTPLDADEQDGLLLYYNYLQNVLDQSITPEEDPMLRFMPTSLGQKDGDVERYQFSVGGYTQRDAPRTPSQQTYDLWTSAFTSTDAEQNTQFYGVLREEPRLTVNLPRQLMRQQEKTYRRVISSPAVLNRLDDIQVFTNRSGLPNDAPYPPRRGGGPTVQLTTETRRYLSAIFNEPYYPSTITFDQIWDGDSSYFYDVIFKFMWENYNPDMAGRNSFATLKDLTVQLADGYVGTMRDDARPHTLRAKPLYRAVRTFFPNTEDLVALLRTDPPSA
jgi:hypothetical protein